MLLRKSFFQNPQHVRRLREFESAIKRAVGDTHPAANDWHPTRPAEYVWTLTTCPPQGRILDIGSNEQWTLGLCELGHRVLAHYTSWDMNRLSAINSWSHQDINSVYRKYEDRLNLFVGYPRQMADYLKPEQFDTIYCLSVLEHVFPDDVGSWVNGIIDLLKPGGRICCTVDYHLDYPPLGGDVSFGHNHDLRSLFLARGIVIEDDHECPWQENFDHLPFTDPDVQVSICPPPQGRLVVYGFTGRKPNVPNTAPQK